VAKGVPLNGQWPCTAGTIYWPWPLNSTCLAIIWSIWQRLDTCVTKVDMKIIHYKT